eukprot:COSAG01_NODE_71514_length_255_cov_1.634615_1_plen_81_part_10
MVERRPGMDPRNGPHRLQRERVADGGEVEERDVDKGSASAASQLDPRPGEWGADTPAEWGRLHGAQRTRIRGKGILRWLSL